MSLHRFTNSFSGDSLLITPGTDLRDVPTPLAELLTDDVRAAFENPQEHFGTLASQCAVGTMKTWLGFLADAETCDIEVNTSRRNTAVIVKIAGFEVSLREDVDLPPPGEAIVFTYVILPLAQWLRS